VKRRWRLNDSGADDYLVKPFAFAELLLREFLVKVVRFSGEALRYGVETIRLEGIPVRITNPARTVVDCFRFRRLVGAGAAREALRERKATSAQIWRAAEACRARSLIAPVLEILAE
jgi:DNA-binding response OmpR family regulator